MTRVKYKWMRPVILWVSIAIKMLCDGAKALHDLADASRAIAEVWRAAHEH